MSLQLYHTACNYLLQDQVDMPNFEVLLLSPLAEVKSNFQTLNNGKIEENYFSKLLFFFSGGDCYGHICYIDNLKNFYKAVLT